MGDTYLGRHRLPSTGCVTPTSPPHRGQHPAASGLDERTAEIAAIAGFIHDVGNCVSRSDHWISSATIARDALVRLGMDYAEVAMVMNAVGNHEEDASDPATPVAAAVVIADKADVHVTRVREMDPVNWDIHDQVNHSAKRVLRVDSDTYPDV
jgi:metal-dependent HD superfamily phosphatase/phosphodiesterase